MTRRDKWAKRDCVMRYRAWADAARLSANAAGGVPLAETTEQVEFIAYYTPPASWSKKKRDAAIGTRKRTKPDGDNVLKLQDSLWSEDSALGRQCVDRFWGERDETVITITYLPREVTPSPKR